MFFDPSFYGVLLGAFMYAHAQSGNNNSELVRPNLVQAEGGGSGSTEYNTAFWLFTKNHPTTYQELKINDPLNATDYNPARLTIFVVHGYFNSGFSPVCNLTRDASLESYDVNVIVVHWKKLAFTNYIYAKNHVRDVSTAIAEMMNHLVATAHMNLDNVTLIGHSLGAHAVGMAGNLTDGKVGTIIALDPASPFWNKKAGPGRILTKFDAKYVQVIHTNGRSLGIYSPIGHADFYPNGGLRQRGCHWYNIACSHGRAYEYLAESINSAIGFYGRSCESYAQVLSAACNGTSFRKMGAPIDKPSPRGIYFLMTNKEPLFARGNISSFGIKWNNIHHFV